MSRATSGSYNGLTPQVLLKAYACGIFPMADSADDPSLFWVEPEERGVLPLKDFHVPRSLAKFIRKDPFTVRVNTNWQGVIDGCATSKPGRESTWINSTIRELYGELFQQGSCHTVEVYKDDVLVGGLYGIQLGAAFFGESMFSHATNASKVALAHLVARLHVGKFKLLDTQFITDHLERLGAMEISRRNYHLLLEGSIHKSADFNAMDQSLSGKQILEIIARAKDEG